MPMPIICSKKRVPLQDTLSKQKKPVLNECDQHTSSKPGLALIN